MEKITVEVPYGRLPLIMNKEEWFLQNSRNQKRRLEEDEDRFSTKGTAKCEHQIYMDVVAACNAPCYDYRNRLV
jgi:hypothetical protein